MDSRIISRLNECTSSVTVKTCDNCFCFLINNDWRRYTPNSEWFVLYRFNNLIRLLWNDLLIVYLIWRHDHEYQNDKCYNTNCCKNSLFHSVNRKQKSSESFVSSIRQAWCVRLSSSYEFLKTDWRRIVVPLLEASISFWSSESSQDGVECTVAQYQIFFCLQDIFLFTSVRRVGFSHVGDLFE